MHVISLDNKLQPGERIGLIAGAGRFPIIFAEAAREQGLSVHGVGIQGMVDDELESLCDTWDSFPVCKVGRAIRSCLRNDAHHAVMAGKVEKVELFAPGRFWNFVPDWRAIHMLWTYVFTQDRRDDTILLAVIREFERDNITFGSALEYCPELLVEHGFLTRRKPSPTQWRDIRFAWDIAKQMGGLDIGQSIVVNDMAVVAVEAIEGTDRCIERAGKLCRRAASTVVKVAKPQQDMRFDVPTIGVKTIQTMHEAGCRCLAVESGMTIMLDQDEVLALAEKLGIAVVSLNAEELQLKAAS
jgi:UDP-2,3-diacylglucosamine hydrolase